MPEGAGSAGRAGFVLVVRAPSYTSFGRKSSGYDARVEHRFTGPPYTIGIEEELMIVDRDTLDLASSIEGLLEVLDGVEKGGEVKPELMESVCEIATEPCGSTTGSPSADGEFGR